MPHTNNRYKNMKQNRSKSFSHDNKKQKNLRYQDLESIQSQLKQEEPKSGQYLYSYKLPELKQLQKSMTSDQFKAQHKINFEDLSISKLSKKGLGKRGFIKMTEIQRCVIPHALVDRDILAASKTGSGKTLSYLIPVVEKLYRQRWSYLDGLGGLIILPTRELAMQVFDVLNSFSMEHQLTVGLLIGGKDLIYEKKNVSQMNILICTPGRLLQHIEETYNFDLMKVQMFVLDEADLLLQMGFLQSVKSIVSHLGPEVQSMLFSATLSKKVHELANISLKHPEHIFLHDINAAKELTSGQVGISQIYEAPVKLQQYYMVMNCEQKINNLFSFLKSHIKCKILVFVSTCKQVRFLYESFKKFKIGMPLLEMHGRMKQQKRMAVFYTFSEKIFSCMFTTNLAARGLDFPKVDWVIQLDCPEDSENYVHRIGRTARYKNEGKSLIFLTEQEKPIIEKLQQAKMNIHKIQQNPKKALTITNSLQAYNSEDIDLKYLAQRAFISYVKFVHQSKDKTVFNIKQLNLNLIAESYGLVQAPYVELTEVNENKVSKIQKMREKQKQKKLQKKELEQEQEQSEEEKQQEIIQQENCNLQMEEELNSQEDDLFKIKKTADEVDVKQSYKPIDQMISKRKLNKVNPEGQLGGRNIVHFKDGKKYTHDEWEKIKNLPQSNPNAQEVEDISRVKHAQRLMNLTEDKDKLKELRQQKKMKKKNKLQQLSHPNNVDQLVELGSSEDSQVE